MNEKQLNDELDSLFGAEQVTSPFQSELERWQPDAYFSYIPDYRYRTKFVNYHCSIGDWDYYSFSGPNVRQICLWTKCGYSDLVPDEKYLFKLFKTNGYSSCTRTGYRSGRIKHRSIRLDL